MQQTPWNSTKIKQCERETGQALLSDEATLVSFSNDFGNIKQSTPAVVCIPQDKNQIQPLIAYANQQNLPVTIRGMGLSQCGQSLPVAGGMTLCMRDINQVDEVHEKSIWVEANASWAQVLKKTLVSHLAPWVLPYNCNLSVAGVLSAGGVGASSFRYGPVCAHVKALEVVDGRGEQQIIDEQSPLFHACLAGQGRCAVILRACLALKPVKEKVKTIFQVFADEQSWLAALEHCKTTVDYVEAFCSPALMGAKLGFEGRRLPLAQWLYGLHVAMEYTDAPPTFPKLNPWKVIHEQDESVSSYYLRHNSRFEAMKMMGQWDLFHPWFECFVSEKSLRKNLSSLLQELPVHYASLIHVVPVAKRPSGFLELPDDKTIYALMILNPGVIPSLKASCLEAIKLLDQRLLSEGGKRYLSGYLGDEIDENFWKHHYGDRYSQWLAVKDEFDPQGIFVSNLHSSF